MKYEQLSLDLGIYGNDLTETMSDNEFLLSDRIQKIQQIIREYGEDNFTISFSGGKDSTVLHYLVDMAIPGNQIPRVYANTGIELNMIKDFVFGLAENDDRIHIIKPSIPIKLMLEQEGYPFKSKQHSKWVDMFQRNGRTQSIENYTASSLKDKDLFRPCPKKLLYQFDESFDLRISDKCCYRLKEKPLDNWAKGNNRPIKIVGIMRSEGGRRMTAQCLAFRNKKMVAFQPLASITKDWEEWFIQEYNIKICDAYYPPYNFIRTGCKGCPFSLHLQDDLDVLEQFFPAERKQCEIIWKPVYDEYRRIGYRLKPITDENVKGQISLFEREG